MQIFVPINHTYYVTERRNFFELTPFHYICKFLHFLIITNMLTHAQYVNLLKIALLIYYIYNSYCILINNLLKKALMKTFQSTSKLIRYLNFSLSILLFIANNTATSLICSD